MNFLKLKLKIIGIIFYLFIGLNGYSQIPEDGLIGYYMLDGNGADSSTYDNEGIITGTVTPTEDRFGNEGQACLFYGGYIDAGNPIQYQLTNEISISAWIKPEFILNWSGIVSKWAGFDNGGFYLGVNPDNNSIRWNLDMLNPIDGNELVLNEWLHIVSTYDGNTVKIYENGVLINESINENGIENVTANLMIGSQYDFPNKYKFTGAIDDVLIYNRALEIDEVEDLFNEQTTSKDEISTREKINIFPNPTDGILMIGNDGLEEILYEVFDSKGAKILEGEYDQQINISYLASGTYHIRLILNKEIVSQKIILY